MDHRGVRPRRKTQNRDRATQGDALAASGWPRAHGVRASRGTAAAALHHHRHGELVRVHRGDSIRLPESLWSAAGVEQEARREIDPWEDKIGDALERIDPSGDGRRRISSEDLFNELVLTVTHRDRPAQLRLSHIMQRLGFARQAIWDPKSKRSAAGYVEDRLSGLDFGKDVEDIVEEPLA